MRSSTKHNARDGAAAAGLRMAFIARPDDHRRGKGESSASVPVDLSAVILDDRADQPGCA